MNTDEKPDFMKLLKVNLLELLPESLHLVVRNLQHLHLGLFFLWKRYYELARRLAGIRYKVYNQKSMQKHDIAYLTPGRLIVG